MSEAEVAAHARRAKLDAARVKALCAQIMPLFNGVDSDIVGGVLGTLVANYFSGHHPAVRDEAKAAFEELVGHMTVALDARRKKPWRTN